MTRRAQIDGPAEPQNLHSVPAKDWAGFDIGQRIIFNSTMADVHAALHGKNAPACLQMLDNEQRFTVAWLSAWMVAIHLGAAADLRAALLYLAELERLNKSRKEIE